MQTTGAAAARDQEIFGDLIRATSDMLAACTAGQLQVIGDFLDRTRQLAATYADTLTSQDAPASTPSPPRAAGDHGLAGHPAKPDHGSRGKANASRRQTRPGDHQPWFRNRGYARLARPMQYRKRPGSR